MQNFFSNVQINGLVYGSPIKEHSDIIRRKGKALETFLLDSCAQETFMNRPFPKNDSEEVKRELTELYHRTNSISDEDLEFATISEKDHYQQWIQFCMERGIIIHKYFFKEIENNTDGLLYFLKNYYNRPRPFQLGYYLNIPIEPVINHSANTGAYPGGHTFNAKLIALILSRKYPGYTNKFMKFADKISESRLNIGLHYPSDVIFGDDLAKWVFSKELF